MLPSAPSSETKFAPLKPRTQGDFFHASLRARPSESEANFANDASIFAQIWSHLGHTFRPKIFLYGTRKSAQERVVKTLPQNVIAFRIAGWDVHLINQQLLNAMRRIADRRDWTIEDVINDCISSFVARHEADAVLETKIIKFPTPKRVAYDTGRKERTGGSL